MSYRVIPLDQFKKDAKKLAKRYSKLKDDLKKLSIELQADPKCGKHIGSDLYKVRVANSSVPTGKSGGFRVIYYILDTDAIYLLTIYSKSDMQNIDETKLLEILRSIHP